MDAPQFAERLNGLLNETLNDGPGPRVVAQITADALADFILNEAGAVAPAALEEVIATLEAAKDEDDD
jgi:hypothetical protein